MEEGRLQECLEELVCAYSIEPNPKTARRIERLQAMIESSNPASSTQQQQQPSEKTPKEVPSTQCLSEEAVRLEKQARELFQRKDYKGTLNLLLKADKLCPSDKLKRRIGRLRDLMAEEEKQEGEEDEEVSIIYFKFNRRVGILALIYRIYGLYSSSFPVLASK